MSWHLICEWVGDGWVNNNTPWWTLCLSVRVGSLRFGSLRLGTEKHKSECVEWASLSHAALNDPRPVSSHRLSRALCLSRAMCLSHAAVTCNCPPTITLTFIIIYHARQIIPPKRTVIKTQWPSGMAHTWHVLATPLRSALRGMLRALSR